ncbi:hypothetical protein Acy02nite_81920 [Actinoplanes cyaneus]|uniref:Uncharacterized protein n=1 Tax=Actinoplanes cyaneus TaxID=52696 RepID=A0A919MGJ7_9ACTN|nr:hypothetical protein [Actinoplanes cyaneus]MCW2143459.1 hypothetical protein [Actinoplanes cyaneus]GID70311.1 hypothetical protein Acy02nite_81920 [Actinoplanes cyaneus]
MASTDSRAQATTRVLRQNADDLHKSGEVLHHSAEESPEQETTQRLHDLGDAVTTEANAIDERADRADRIHRSVTARSPRSASDGSSRAQ